MLDSKRFTVHKSQQSFLLKVISFWGLHFQISAFCSAEKIFLAKPLFMQLAVLFWLKADGTIQS